MHTSNLFLKFIKDIKITVTDIDGKEHVITMLPDEIATRTKSVMYQCFSNAVGYEIERKVEEVCYQNLPKHELYESVRKGKVDFKEYVSVSESYFNKTYYFSLKVDGESKKFEFKTQQEAEETLKLAECLHRYLNYNKRSNGK